jgi:hypothetical protein
MPDRYRPIQKNNIMTWITSLSSFILKSRCKFIKNAVPMDKGFRLKELNPIAEAVLKFCGREVGPLMIYNHPMIGEQGGFMSTSSQD